MQPQTSPGSSSEQLLGALESIRRKLVYGFPQSVRKNIFFLAATNYTLEWFSEAGSAPIRSAVKFYFDIDVRIFFNFFKKYFFRSTKKNRKNWKFSIFRFFREKKLKKVEKIWRKNRKISNSKIDFLKISKKIEKSKNSIFFRIFFLIDRKTYFLKKLKKNPDTNIEVKFHCGSYGSTPSLLGRVLGA